MTTEESLSERTVGFMNVVTWAEEADLAVRKSSNYLSTFDWIILGVGDCAQVNENASYSENMEAMLEQARDNPLSIILGTFHSYPVN